MPLIARDFNAAAHYAWVASAYILANAVMLPIAGRLAETRSPRGVYATGMLLFLVGSILCALAPGLDFLIAARAIQGLGGGAMVATGGTILAQLFAPRERGQAFGYFGIVMAAGSLSGPVLGGLLAGAFTWRLVFLLNIPVGLPALWLVWRHVPARPLAPDPRFDWGGATALVFWAVPMLLILSWGGTEHPWLSAPILGLAAVMLLSLLTFYRLESTRESPLLDLRLLRNPVLIWTSVGAVGMTGTITAAMLFLPLYLVEARDLSVIQAGLVLVPGTLGGTVGALLVGRLMARWGRYKLLTVLANLAMLLTCGLFWAFFSETMPLGFVCAVIFALGFGAGMLNPLYPTAVQNSVGPERVGTATSLSDFATEIANTLAAAGLGAVLAFSLHANLPRYLPPALATSLGVTTFRDEKELLSLLHARVDELTTQIEAGDAAARAKLAQNPLLTAEQQARVQANDPAVKHEIRQIGPRLEAQVGEVVNATVTAALRDVVLAGVGCAVMGLLASLFLPDAQLS